MIKSALQSSLTNDVRYRSMSAGNVPSNEYLIQTTVVGATPAATVEFDVSAYAGIYRHLKVVGAVRDTSTAFSLRNGTMTFNNDSTSYYSHILEGNGSTVTSSGISTSVQGYPFIYTGSATTTIFSPFVIDILDPFSSVKNTTVRALSGVAGENITLRSFGYFDTQAITSMIINATGTAFATGSRISLYGVTA